MRLTPRLRLGAAAPRNDDERHPRNARRRTMDKSVMMDLMNRLRAQERWARHELEAYRTRELRSLREHAYAHSPFYREFHRGLFDAPLHELPVLTKAVLMDRFDDVVTDRD